MLEVAVVVVVAIVVVVVAAAAVAAAAAAEWIGFACAGLALGSLSRRYRSR